jgi:hypothetical protein
MMRKKSICMQALGPGVWVLFGNARTVTPEGLLIGGRIIIVDFIVPIQFQ